MQPFPGILLVCPALVGRTRELEAVRRYLAGPGPPGLLVSGETGIGKSRLAREAKAQADGLGFQTFWGRCFESDRAVPYAPLVDVLCTLFAERSAEEILGRLGSLAGDVAKLVPHPFASALDVSPAQPVEPGLGKQRLFQALADLFLHSAGTCPVLLVIEDLHWCDEATLEFLLYLQRRAPARSILLLMTHRSDEVHPALGSFLAAVDRERLADEVALRPLTASETEEMLQAIFHQEHVVRPDLLVPIYALTEGNPFFIEEVLKSLSASNDGALDEGRLAAKLGEHIHVPRSINHAIQRRLEQLGLEARTLATVAAVAGRRFDVNLLMAVTRQHELTLLALIKDLVEAQLVVEESSNTFAFRHALTREAIYTQLLGREREAYHRQILEALERLHGADGPPSSDIAYHALASRAWAKAMDYCYRLGRHARSVYAPRAAVEHFTRALEAAQALGAQPPPALFGERGQAYETLGEFEHARSDLEAVLGMARAQGDLRAEWETLMDLGMLWAGHEYSQAGQYYRQALDHATRMGDRPLLARSLNRVGNWHLNLGRPQQALRYHRRALEAFRRLEDQGGVAETLDLLGVTSYMGGDMEDGWRYYGEAVDCFTALDDRRGLVSSLSTRYGLNNAYHGAIAATVTAATVDIDPAESVRQCRRALNIARDIGWRPGEAYAMINLALVLGTQGRYGEAFEMVSGSYRIAEDMGHVQWKCRASTILGALYLDIMAYPQAVAYLEEALASAKEFGAVFWIHTAAGRLASAYTQQARLNDAASVLGEYDVRVDDHIVGSRILLCSRAELALAQHHVDDALETVEMLKAIAFGADGRAPYGLLMLRGQAHSLAGRYHQAEEDFRAARDVAAERKLTPALWRAHVHLARAYRALGRRADARREIAAARAIVDRIAAELPDTQIQAAFLRGANRMTPPMSMRASLRTGQAPGGLTAREQEVARLIARGMTNRQIAQRLVIGERTVESHVGNIMSKLGVNARAQIISWAFEKGLVDGPE